jgi:hypothetical protein
MNKNNSITTDHSKDAIARRRANMFTVQNVLLVWLDNNIGESLIGYVPVPVNWVSSPQFCTGTGAYLSLINIYLEWYQSRVYWSSSCDRVVDYSSVLNRIPMRISEMYQYFTIFHDDSKILLSMFRFYLTRILFDDQNYLLFNERVKRCHILFFVLYDYRRCNDSKYWLINRKSFAVSLFCTRIEQFPLFMVNNILSKYFKQSDIYVFHYVFRAGTYECTKTDLFNCFNTFSWLNQKIKNEESLKIT